MCLQIPQLTIRFPNIFHDGTERPIQRPKDAQVQKAYYSGKKKQHTLKNNLVINVACKVVLLTPSFEGRIHDKQIADTVGNTGAGIERPDHCGKGRKNETPGFSSPTAKTK